MGKLASFDEILNELAEINASLAGATEQDIRGLAKDEGWKDKVQKWFEKVKEFAQSNHFKGFSIAVTAGFPPSLGVTLDFEFKE
ncbi:MAG: hypothetical protein HPY75_10135 [Actinobacteria bacterium]|nr:hypothetical protein [Actinomycetota bacterium]